jgi:energy-coupling factor transporter ATP-binding protein EcfA2
MKYLITGVFTPTLPAMLTFVEREKINERLVDSLQTPGKQLVLYGYTGSGKTTLIINKLNQLTDKYIISRCVSSMTYEDLVLDAFDQLDPYYRELTTSTKCTTKEASVAAEYGLLRGKLSTIEKAEIASVSRRILPPQLTPQRLAIFMGIAGYCWVIEDFHKLSSVENKKRLSQTMKVFVDCAFDYPKLKIIAIGQVGTAREFVEFDKELQRRVTEIHIPLMEMDELREILRKGEKLLNIEMDQQVTKSIIRHSNGLAAVCHQLALNCCRSIGMVETLDSRGTITAPHFKTALKQYIEEESDTTKVKFDKAIRPRRESKYGNYGLILFAIAEDKSEHGIIRADILANIKRREPNYPSGNLTKYLKELMSPARGELIRYDEPSGKYLYNNAFHKAFALAYLGKAVGEARYEYKIEDLFDKDLSADAMLRILETVKKNQRR